MKITQLQKYLEFMKETAFLAGRLTLGYFNTSTSIDFKADNTPVTIADRKAEQLIRSRIEKVYPDHAIVGEEFGVSNNEDSGYRWIIDPIDGTKSFIKGVPLYSVLIGLEIAGNIEAGVMYFPALDEMVYAGTSFGCWWNGRQVHVTQVDSLDKAVVAFSSASSFYEYNRIEEWRKIQHATYFQAGWGDAYGYALVATGRIEIMLDPIMNVWDCGPLPVILQEAGGYFGDWQGNKTIYANEGLGSNIKLLPDILQITRKKNELVSSK